MCYLNENETDSTATLSRNQLKTATDADGKNRWSINEMKKILGGSSRKERYKGLCLKVATSKMRCSIRVKEEFENAGGKSEVIEYIMTKCNACFFSNCSQF